MDIYEVVYLVFITLTITYMEQFTLAFFISYACMHYVQKQYH